MEQRHATPYLQSLLWVLHDIDVERQRESQQDSSARIEKFERSLSVEIVPYLGNIPLKPDSYKFPEKLADGETGPTVDEVLAATNTDVAAAWNSAFDSIANNFPILQDETAEQVAVGLKMYLRLDAWKAVFPYSGSKYVVAVVGVYDSADYSNVRTYLNLFFEDKEAQQTRSANIERLTTNLAQAESILAPEPTYPGWADIDEARRNDLRTNATQQRIQIQQQLAQMEQQLHAPLSTLLGMPAVQESLGVLVSAIFASLKASDESWSDIDVAQLMQRFTLPAL